MTARKDIDTELLAAIKVCEAVPTAPVLARMVGVSVSTVLDRLSQSPALSEVIEKRGWKWLTALSEKNFLKKCSASGWIGSLPDYARTLVEERLFSLLLKKIRTFDGVPTGKGLARVFGVFRETITARLKEKPALEKEMESRGREWLAGLSENALLIRISEPGWVNGLPRYARKIVENRFLTILRRKIKKFKGVPIIYGLAIAMGVNPAAIRTRIMKNPILKKMMEKRGRQWLSGLSEKAFLKGLSKKEWTKLPQYARKLIDGRLHAILLTKLRGIDGIPNGYNLACVMGKSSNTILRRIKASAVIKEAMEKRGREWLANLSEKEFLGKMKTKIKATNLPPYAHKLVEKRFSAILRRKIKAYDGVPSIGGLAKAMGVADSTVEARVSKSPLLNKEMERRGKEWLESLDEKAFLKKYSNRGLVASFPEYAREIVKERSSSIILGCIRASVGIPTISTLARALCISGESVTARVFSDSTLWLAYYQKCGLTPDQAIELALERNDESKAAIAVLERRLPHLHAYREMVGLIRCFGNLLEGRILEVTLYPEPLSKAAAELSVQIDVCHTPMRSFRKNESPELMTANAAVLQGIHRLATEGLTNLFSKIHESIGEGKNVIATYSIKHAYSDSFLQALLENGFILQESGILRIEPPIDAILRSYGVDEDNMKQVRDKIKCESRVLVLTTTNTRTIFPIPQLEKTTGTEGETVLSPTTKEIDSPPGIVKEICARFLQDPVVLPSAPFIVDVVKGEKLVAVLGYDMDPTRKNSIESAVYPHAPPLDFRKVARTLATRAEERIRLGIKPNQVSKVPLERIR